MRKLTITRNTMGTYGSYYSLKIYIEDHSDKAETKISGVPCRFLGFVESDETKTFEIDEKEAKVFAIMSEALKNYKYDYRVISAGSQDVILSGKSCCDRRQGSLFYFDGETPPDAIEAYDKWRRIYIGLVIGVAVVTVTLVLLIKLL